MERQSKRDAVCWVVETNRLYLISWGRGTIRMDCDLQKAFRYQSERDAEFVAKKVCGDVVQCRIGKDGLEVIGA